MAREGKEGGEGDEGEETMRSGPSEKSARIRFTNASRDTLCVYWIDYEGSERPYSVLRPAQFVDVNTFDGHLWIFKKTATGERFTIKNDPVFVAKAARPPNAPAEARLNRYITAPLRSLRLAVLLFLASVVSLEDVPELNVPASLGAELVRLIRLHTEPDNQNSSNTS